MTAWRWVGASLSLIHISICCQLVHRPKVIIFDEPLIGLDPHAIKELKEMFGELRADGASLLISTHMIDSVENYWDVAHIMMHGRLAAVKRPDDGGERSLEEPVSYTHLDVYKRQGRLQGISGCAPV